MTDRLALPPRYRDQLEALLSKHVPGVEVWAYGSRVNGSSHGGSDLDLVLRGPALEPLDGGFYDLLEGIEKSNIPILVQAHDWAMLPESFQREIERDYVVIQECTNRTVAGKRRDVPFAQLLEEPVRNGIYKKKEFHGRGVKVVNMGELFANPRLRDVHMRRVELSESERHRLNVQSGDLLFARRSLVAEGAGKCSVVLEINEPTTFESSIIRARPDPTKADSLFLSYYFNSPIGLHALDTIRRHVAVAGITGTDLAQLPVEVPPLPTQRVIAHVLGTLDDKIELNRRMNETLEQMARALFKSWFVDFEPVRAKIDGRWRRGESLPGLPAEHYDLFPDRLVDSELGEIPEGWEMKALGEVAIISGGKQLSKNKFKEDGPIAVFGGAGFMGYTDGHNAEGYVISVGRVGAYCGQFVAHRGKAWINNNASLISQRDGIPGEWLLLALHQLDIDTIRRGAAQPFVSNSDLATMKLFFLGQTHSLRSKTLFCRWYAARSPPGWSLAPSPNSGTRCYRGWCRGSFRLILDVAIIEESSLEDSICTYAKLQEVHRSQDY